MKKTFTLISIIFIVSACAQTTYTTCDAIERDLTQNWGNRSYWCATTPYINYAKKEQKHIAKQQSQVIKQNPTTSNQPVFLPQVTPSNSSPSSKVSFAWHDSKFNQSELASLMNTNKPIKLRGCRLENESSNLNFGRALRVRNELKKLGFNHKITILNDVSCTGEQSVKVNL